MELEDLSYTVSIALPAVVAVIWLAVCCFALIKIMDLRSKNHKIDREIKNNEERLEDMIVDLINYPLQDRKDKLNKKFEKVRGLMKMQD